MSLAELFYSKSLRRAQASRPMRRRGIPRRRKFLFEPLEPRLLLAADPIVLATSIVDPNSPIDRAPLIIAPDAPTSATTGSTSTTAGPSSTTTSTPPAINGAPVALVDSGAIQGVKFKDVNFNGARDAGEPGLAGRTIFLDSNADGLLDAGETSTVTDASGAYAFVALPPATYRVAESVGGNWIQTAPAGGVHIVTLGNGQVVTDRDFGNFEIVLPPAAAFDDSYSTNENTVLTGNVLANDLDPMGDVGGGGIFGVSLVEGPTHGDLVLGGVGFFDLGAFTYTPDLDFRGTDTFTYVALNGVGTPSNVATVTIAV